MNYSIDLTNASVTAERVKGVHVYSWTLREWLILVLLVISTFIAFHSVLSCEFVSYDDGDYVTDNAHIKNGISLTNLAWAWSTTHAANWHPLTWMSLMLDSSLLGNSPWGYHFTNLLLHTANTLLLFVWLYRATGAAWCSAAVGALFAIHPLRVESVAWVSERKDVLSAFFGLLALCAYSNYVVTPNLKHYLGVGLCMMLSLLAKPMLVTLPFLFLLLDYWPLCRWNNSTNQFASFRSLVLEKVPLLFLSLASCSVTVWAQHRGGALEGLAHISLLDRLGNASVSYVEYLRQMFWPFGLAPLYPHPGEGLPGWQITTALLVLLTITMLIFWNARNCPYLPIGWLWYVGTLVPVIGIVQVGFQARADRYTYIPQIGIYLLLIWSLADLAVRWNYQKTFACCTVLVLGVLIATTRKQTRFWHNSIVFWTHTLEVTENNYIAHSNLAGRFLEREETEKAIEHLSEALRIKPDFAEAHNNLGTALLKKGNKERAIYHFGQALYFNPDYAEAHNNMGLIFLMKGELVKAEHSFAEALRLNPNNAQTHSNLGGILLAQGNGKEAILHFQESLRLKPDNPQVHNNLGVALLKTGKREEAVRHFQDALRLQPKFSDAKRNLRIAQAKEGIRQRTR